MFKIIIIRHRSILAQRARLQNVGDKHRMRAVIRGGRNTAGKISVCILIEIVKSILTSGRMAKAAKFVNFPSALKTKMTEQTEGSALRQHGKIEKPCFYDHIVRYIRFVDRHQKAFWGIRNLNCSVNDAGVIFLPASGGKNIQSVSQLKEGRRLD